MKERKSGSYPLKTVEKPRRLTCCHCGSEARGRQWSIRDTGYGVCTRCADENRARHGEGVMGSGLAGETNYALYGVRGYHYDLGWVDEELPPPPGLLKLVITYAPGATAGNYGTSEELEKWLRNFQADPQGLVGTVTDEHGHIVGQKVAVRRSITWSRQFLIC